MLGRVVKPSEIAFGGLVRMLPGLREDRLEDPPVEEAVAAADHEAAGLPGDRPQEAVLPPRHPGEADAGLDVVAVVPVHVVHPVLGVPRRPRVLVAQAQVEGQRGRDLPVVLGVEVVLVDPVLEVEGAVGLGVAGDAAVPERRVGSRVDDTAAARGEAPEPPAEALRQVVERGEADVGPRLEVVARPEDGAEVVDELVVRLVPRDREAAGVADDRARDGRPGEADDRRLVALLMFTLVSRMPRPKRNSPTVFGEKTWVQVTPRSPGGCSAGWSRR